MTKINKSTARKMARGGAEVFAVPCKVRLENAWITPTKIVLADEENAFDRWVNRFECYNCNSELGYYAAFYINESE